MKIHWLFIILLGLAAGSCKDPKTNIPDPPAARTTDTIKRLPVAATFPVIDRIFSEHMEKNHFPGMAYGIVIDGKLVHTNAFGLANVETKNPATAQTNFRIASMSKSFTAMAVLKLRDEGKLRLGDPAFQYIPALKNVVYPTTDSQPFTIEHLLTMSAGFPEDNPWGDRQLDDSEEALRAFIRDGISFSNTPGIAFEYSNLGFALLGQVVTNVSGKPYQQYITENILRPLQMNDTRWEYSEIPAVQLAMGYRWEDDRWKAEPLLHDGTYGAMGGLICSVEDFSKYIAFHLQAWPPRDREESSILKRSSLREMHQLQRLGGLFMEAKNHRGQPCPALTGYGYGLGFRKDCYNLVSIRHGGGLPGFGSEWRFYPDLGIGIVSLSNLTYGSLGLQNARALDTLISMTNLIPQSIAVTPILLQRQNEIIEVLQAWKDTSLTVFAENFFLDRSLESWKKYAKGILDDAGKIIRVSEMMPENRLRARFIIEGEKKNIEVFFTLTPEKTPLIQQLDLSIKARE